MSSKLWSTFTKFLVKGCPLLSVQWSIVFHKEFLFSVMEESRGSSESSNMVVQVVQAEFRKCRGTRDQIANIHWIIEKAREFQKNIYFCFIDYAKAFDCMDHNKLWQILKDMGIPDHLTCLLRNLYAGQEATVRTGHGTTDWLQIGKGYILYRLYIRVIYCHPAYLTYMQSTSWETLG